jgi:hypothetical protein
MNSIDLILKVGFGGVISILSLKVIHSLIVYFSGRSRCNRGYGAAALLAEAVEEEKRKHSRLDINVPVKMETSDGPIEAHTKNLTLAGAFVCCQNPLLLKEKFRLSILLPHRRYLTLNAEVVWSNVSVAECHVVNRGMGIRFIHTTENDREILDELISSRHLASYE